MTKKASTNITRAKRAARKATVPRAEHGVVVESDARFREVIALIEAARDRAYQAVNAELVSLYWQLGEYISRKIASAAWGDGVVEELASSLARQFPGLRASRVRTCFGCASSTRPTNTRRKSHHWYDKCPGHIICSSSPGVNGLRNASSTFVLLPLRNGPAASWNAS